MIDSIKEKYQQIKVSDIAQRMRSGAFWSFTGTALGKFLVFLSGILCARILGKEQFGQLGMVRSTLGMFIILGAGGIGVTATRYIAAFRKEQQAHAASIYRMSFLFSLTLGIVITALALATSQFLSADYLKVPELTKPLLIGSVILLLSILNSSENGTLTGLEDFKSIAINTLIGSFFEAACMVVGAYFYQLEGAVAGFAIGVLCLYIANKLSAIRALNKAGISAYVKSVYREDWALIFSYSIPATLSALTVTPVFWLVRYMLVRASNYGELGIFEAADQWKVMLLFVPGAICQIVLPIMSSITDHRLFRKALIGNLALIGGIAAILALVSWFVAPILMLLYGRTFTNTATLIALAFSTIPTALSQILEMTLYSREKMWTSFGFNIVWGISTVALAYLFLENQQGAFGIAMAILLAYILKLLCMGSYLSIITKGGKQ